MPTVTLNKTVFEQLVGKELPLKELKDRISMLGTDLESIEGDEIHVEIFPNRPDLLSEQGFARAFSSFIGIKTGLREYSVKESGQKVIIESSVKNVRPKTACAIIKNIQLDEEKLREIIQIQEKLHITYGRNRKKCAIGIYPLNKIVFPITYKADTPQNIQFTPLDSSKEMSGAQILLEHPKGEEFAHLLEGEEMYPFFIDAAHNILSMPPIINSQTIGCVEPSTKNLFIECSGFDFQTLSTCLNIIVTALADMGGSIESLLLEYQHPAETKTTPALTPTKIKLDLAYINKRLGLELQEEDAIMLLAKMGFGYSKKTQEVLVPAYRADILHQADFVEDIAIAYGYENFNEEIPNVSTIGKEDKLESFARKVREILVGMQLLEAKNYHLITHEALNEKMREEGKGVPLLNALGDHNHLRSSLIPSLLTNLAENQHHEYPQNMFEVGRIFEQSAKEQAAEKKSDTGISEKDHLSIVLCHEKADFTQIRQVLDALLRALGIEKTTHEMQDPRFISGRAAQIVANGKKCGILGEIHPQVLENFSLITPVAALELDMEVLLKQLE